MDEGCADAFLCRECFFETDKVNNVVPKIAENNKQYLQSLSMHALNANEANPIIPAISVPSVQMPDFSNITVTALKSKLIQLNLSTNGRKQILYDRLAKKYGEINNTNTISSVVDCPVDSAVSQTLNPSSGIHF